MRHGHAEAASGRGADMQRALLPEGRTAASEAGARLAAAGLEPDYVLCSAAQRARETWTALQPALTKQPTVELDRTLYGAGVDETFTLVSETPATVETLLLIGHNPTVAQLAGTFPAQTSPDSGARIPDFLPASLALVELEVPWSHASPGTGTMRLL